MILTNRPSRMAKWDFFECTGIWLRWARESNPNIVDLHRDGQITCSPYPMLDCQSLGLRRLDKDSIGELHLLVTLPSRVDALPGRRVGQARHSSETRSHQPIRAPLSEQAIAGNPAIRDCFVEKHTTRTPWRSERPGRPSHTSGIQCPSDGDRSQPRVVRRHTAK